jgi:DMSO/TMAO reductase YedYZ molybdopterin-dependent catalytic subunit
MDPARETQGTGSVPAVASDEGKPVGRRVVLAMLGLGAVGVAVGGPVSRAVDAALDPLRRADPTGLTGLVPGDGWRYYSVTATQPSVPVADFRLTVAGLVSRPAEYSYADLESGLPQTSITADFQCVTGWRVEDVPWTGVLLRDLLDEAGVQPGAKAVTFRSLDGVYTESLTLEQARASDVLVATRMYGETVTADHGGPVRLYVAPMYGYKSLKWLGGIEVVDAVEPGYWEVRGYDIDAYIGASNGRSDEPV